MTDPAETAEITSPIAWQRWLSIQLVRLRKAAGVKQADAAKAIGASVGKVSYLEAGDRPISVDELAKLLDVYRVSSNERESYIGAAERSVEPGWWDEYSDDEVTRDMRRYAGLEDAATRVREYTQTVVHGLLQTPDYARAVIAGSARTSPEVVARRVDFRMARQRVLTRAEQPLTLDVILDEATLHRQIGGSQILGDQLRHMLVTIETYPSLSVRILPFEVGAHRALFGGFALLDFGWHPDARLLVVENDPAPSSIDSPADFFEYSGRFQELDALALDRDQSYHLVSGLM